MGCGLPGAARPTTVSRSGTLVYVPAHGGGTPTLRSLVWVDRSGKETPISAPPRAYEAPRLSPDGTRVALTIREPDNDIYMWDLDARGPLRRLTFDPGIDAGPVWTPDGQRIVFRSRPVGQAENLFTHAADGSGYRRTTDDEPELSGSVLHHSRRDRYRRISNDGQDGLRHRVVPDERLREPAAHRDPVHRKQPGDLGGRALHRVPVERVRAV